MTRKYTEQACIQPAIEDDSIRFTGKKCVKKASEMVSQKNDEFDEEKNMYKNIQWLGFD